MNELKSNDQENDPERNIQQPPPPIEAGGQAINGSAGGDHGDHKKINWPQRIEAVCAVLLVLITGTYTYYAAGQLHEMKRSTDAAEKAATAATNAIDQSKRDDEAAITAQKEIAKQAVASSQQSFDKSFAATVAQFRLDQRAWVGVKEVWVTIKHEESTNIFVKVINSGKTPALDVHFVLDVEWPPKDTAPGFIYSEANSEGRVVLLPGVEVSPMNSEPIFTQFQVNQINDGSIRLYVAGTMWYKDTFKRDHKTLFCYLFEPKLKGMAPCRFHNEAD